MRHSQICYRNIWPKRLGRKEEEEIHREEQEPGSSQLCNKLLHRMMTGAMKNKMMVMRKISFKIPWINLTKKYGNLVRCDVCDEYICPKYYDKIDIFLGDGFFVFFASNHKLIMKTPERRQWCCSGIFAVNFEYISHLVLVFILLTLNM